MRPCQFLISGIFLIFVTAAEILPDSGTVGNDLVMVSPDTGITHWLDELQDNRPALRHAYAMSELI
jgi:hypothetical protein